MRPVSPAGRPCVSLRHVRPRVGRLEDAAVRPAAVETPWPAQPLVHRRIEHVRVDGVDHQVRRAGPAIVGQTVRELLPGAAPVGRLEDAALAGVAPEIADCRHVHDVRIARMGDHPRNLERVAEADVRERAAAVGGLVEAVAPRHAVAVVRLARADPEHAGIGLEDGDVADRGRSVVVEDRRPGRAGVRRLPDAARCGRGQRKSEVGVERLDVGDPAAGRPGADGAELVVGEQRGGIDRGGLRPDRLALDERDQGQHQQGHQPCRPAPSSARHPLESAHDVLPGHSRNGWNRSTTAPV